MLSFINQQIIFYISLIVILFIPGYFFLLAIEAKRKLFSSLERFIISFGASTVIVDLIMMAMGKTGIQFTRLSIITAIILFSAVCYLICKFTRKNTPENQVVEQAFSKNQVILIILILFLTIFIKTAYLHDAIFPTSTDLGHHMYWSKLIAESGKIPQYAEKDIITVNGNYQISQPQGIADFIIGEHLIFAAIALVSGTSFISSFPSLVLFLVNIMTIVAIFILALRFFENYSYGKTAAIMALFLIGPLYAISSPQAKFVSGGVIGNIIGNLLFILAIYFYYRALAEKKSILLAAALLFSLGLFYTHHLTAFIFLFTFAFALLIFILFNIRQIKELVKEWLSLIFSRETLLSLVICFLFLALIYTPTYLNKEAIDTAVGTPTKITRTGFTFSQLSFSAGEARMALGLAGILLLLLWHKKNRYSSALLLGWATALFIMSLKPQWLYVDIPSDRVANYIVYPLAILGALALVSIFNYAKDEKINYLPAKLTSVAFIIIFTFILFSGLYDNGQYFGGKNNTPEAVQTFEASRYIAQNVQPQDQVLKDHVYVTADAWIKLFFMRDYNFPFSRGLLKRYEDNLDREMCTLWMISTPSSENGQKCYQDLGINFVMVNSLYDSAQFEKSKRFWKIYNNEEISIYYKTF